MNNLKFIDLCSGTGAFNIILSKYGAKCVFSNDIEPSSLLINQKNRLCDNFSTDDINEVNIEDIPKHDILTAGFPCQPFSIAGERKGFEDDRSNVFEKIIKILKYHEPSIVILENVKNLKTIHNGEDFKYVLGKLKELNYFIKYDILNTHKITGIPQNRERLYIVCFKDKSLIEIFNFEFNKMDKKNIVDFLESNIDEKYYYSDRFKVYDIIKDHVKKHVNTNTVYQYRRTSVRENKNKLVPTLTANCGGGGHNVPLILDDKGIRKLTPRECFNLQGFDKEYILPSELCDSKLYKLAGNSITLNVLEKIIKKIDELLVLNKLEELSLK